MILGVARSGDPWGLRCVRRYLQSSTTMMVRSACYFQRKRVPSRYNLGATSQGQEESIESTQAPSDAPNVLLSTQASGVTELLLSRSETQRDKLELINMFSKKKCEDVWCVCSSVPN